LLFFLSLFSTLNRQLIIVGFFVFLDEWKEIIAQGACGIVSLVVHIASGRILIWKQVAIVKGKEELILREAGIGRAVSSEYVVPILDSFIEKGFLYIVTEYYEKGTLATVLEKVKKSGKPIGETVLFFSNCFCFFSDIIFCI
jgi:serine/threonine protein kinase